MEFYELLITLFGEHTVASIIVSITAFIGTATLLVEAAEKIAGITPSTKDDQFVSNIKCYLGAVVAFLDKVAMSKRGK